MLKTSISTTGKKALLLSCALVTGYLAHAQQVTAALNNVIKNTPQGHTMQVPGLLSEQIPALPYQKIVLPGPQFLISDDPEYIRVPEGVALREPVQPGSVRLYLYNVNGVQEPEKMDRKIAAVIKNTGSQPMHIRMLKYSSQKPTTNYFFAGKQGLADFFQSQPETVAREVKPGASICLDPKQDKAVVKYDELVHGFYEFVIDQPGEISIVQTDLKTPATVAAARVKNALATKQYAGAGRGTYGISNYRIIVKDTLDTKNGLTQVLVADGEKDPWVIGKEATTGELKSLDGNYGIFYNIELSWKSTDGKALALMTWNPRGDNGQWCGGMANTMVVSGGKFKEGVIQLPSNQLVTTKAPEAILIQVFTPPAGGGVQKVHFTYSPPGASCLPTPLVLVPVDLK
ncbi:copper amine oxidase [Chitinophaga eiseniae]|uniref:Copper amine oxidase n=1 Tax=Chitinophaga eiseniae TaxID=634771 RepID=A0A847SMJ3_9BACT|nr:copper amine oxidase [Chitinophaga eiseniae]NLR81404.1 copper amine oxidase [Chitinophaga eiseniae]